MTRGSGPSPARVRTTVPRGRSYRNTSQSALSQAATTRGSGPSPARVRTTVPRGRSYRNTSQSALPQAATTYEAQPSQVTFADCPTLLAGTPLLTAPAVSFSPDPPATHDWTQWIPSLDTTAPTRPEPMPPPTMASSSVNGDVSVAPPDSEPQMDPARSLAVERNLQRIEAANQSDQAVIGKFLPSDPKIFFPTRLLGPDDSHSPPPEWLQHVKSVAATDCPTPDAPTFQFGTDPTSLKLNSQLLEDAEFDLDRLLMTQQTTTVGHGSEFRPLDQLVTIIGNHPSFQYLCQTFTSGMDYIFTRELSETERTTELLAQLERGNHKSATDDEPSVAKLIAKDVRHGFSLPLPADIVPRIKGALVQPCGLATQFGLSADGSRILKKRLTHDLSFSLTTDDASVNSRIDMSQYPEMVYGWCLLRIIHFIVCLRSTYPGEPIMISKFDYSDAYRRISHHAKAAAQSIVVLAGVAYLMLRLAFGGSPNPPCFCGFSETLTDVANELSCSDYDPAQFSSPTVQPEHLQPRSPFPDDAPFATAIPPAVEVPVTLTSRKDCFIDDIIAVFLATKRNLHREGHTVPLAVHVLSRPHAGSAHEPIQRRPLLGPEKLTAEGRASELAIVLGWLLNTRQLLLSLPDDKYKAWSADIDELLQQHSTTIKALESTIGRLNHAAYVIPLSRHFLNRLRARTNTPVPGANQTLRLSVPEIEDLRLWSSLLRKAHSGISLNLLTIRTPTRVGWSDSCPFGLGGYTQTGRAWRLRIPPTCVFFGDDTANNVLEFLGMAITALLMLDDSQSEQYPCLLSLGDNTSAIGWIFKSGRLPRNSPYFAPVQMIARHLALQVTNADAQLTSQHLPGKFNDVADLLSFEGHLRGTPNPLTTDCPPDDVLTHRIRATCSQIVPMNFEISPLPPDILSFACAVLQTTEQSWMRNKKPRGKIVTESGDGGANSLSSSIFVTPTSILYQTSNNSFSPSASWCNTEFPISTSREQLLHSVRNPWWSRLCAMPLAMWLRRFGQVTGPAPSTTKATRSLPPAYAQQ